MPTLWPHVPTLVAETLEFATDVRQAYNGEFRDSLKKATQKLQLDYVLREAEAARMEGLFRSAPLGQWYVPIWPDATRFVGTVSAGASSIAGIEGDADYRAGGKAVILDSDQKAEVIDVLNVSGSTLNVDGTVAASYTGTENNPLIIAPVRTCIAPTGLSLSVRIGVTDASIVFISIEPADLADTGLFPTLGSYDVVNDPSFVNTPLDGSITQELDFIDNGFGAYALESIEQYKRRRSSLALYDVSYADRWARRKWLHRIRGRDRPFWLPTWKNDLRVTTQAGAGASTLVVAKTTTLASDLIGKGVYIDAPAGAIARTIVNATIGSTTNTLTLNATHGILVPVTSRVSLMPLVRFDTDVIELEHINSRDGFITSFNATVVEVLQ
jgi:hypothetical protein